MAVHLDKIRNRLLRGAASVNAQPGAPVSAASTVGFDTRMQMSFATYKYVLGVLLLLASYLYFIADDRYVTMTKVVVQSSQISSDLSIAGGVGGLVGGGAATQDATLLREFVHSSDMLRILDSKLNYRVHFSAPGRDWYYKLSPNSSFEGFLEFYRERVEILIDAESGILTINTQGYDPEFANRVAETILEEAAKFINGINQKIAREEIGFVEDELRRSEISLTEAESQLLDFQARTRDLNPLASSAAFQLLINELQGKISEAEIELKNLRTFQSEQSFEVIAARDRLQALQEQLETERAKIGPEQQVSVKEQSAEFNRLQLGVKFATERYKTILSTLSQKRIESYRKIKNMVIIQTPKRADGAILPDRDYILITLLILMSLAYAIFVMVIATIQEHRDV